MINPDRHQDESTRLKVRVLVSSANGRLSLREAAASLGVTPRTLQRRLESEETTYRAVVDEARLELAAQALARSGTAAATAVVIGFSEPAAFHRAFKRWTGMTPRKFML